MTKFRDSGISEEAVPRILYISQHWPHKARSASELRAFHVRRALEKIGQVDVVVLNVEGGGEDWLESADDKYKLLDVLAVNDHPNKGVREKLRWVLDPRSYYPQGWSVDKEVTARIFRQVEEYDLVWFSKIKAASMFGQWVWPRSVLDIDDVPSAFEASVIHNGGSLLEQTFARIRRFSWQRRERLLEDRFTVLAVCSEDDRRYLHDMGMKATIHVIPNGFEQPAKEPIRTRAVPPRIGFFGVLDYYPNLEGIQWFVNECWPRIKLEVPDARLRLAGRYSNGALQFSQPGIDWLGWVEDIDTEIATWSLMVVPIRKGAGTRVKIALAFSRKCPIVSTSLGALGYEVENQEEILLADDPRAFAQACIRLLRQPEEAAAMAERAQKKFLAKWTWEAIQPRIWAAAEDCLRRSASPAVPKPAAA